MYEDLFIVINLYFLLSSPFFVTILQLLRKVVILQAYFLLDWLMGAGWSCAGNGPFFLADILGRSQFSYFVSPQWSKEGSLNMNNG